MATGNNQVVIENPVINSPIAEPQCHFRFSDEGITNQIVAQRRTSSYFIPIHDGRAVPPSPPAGERGRVRGCEGDFLNPLLECTRQKKKDNEAKLTTAQTLWISAVNNHAQIGRWTFLEIRDPWAEKNSMRAKMRSGAGP